jgi:general secretion pathway protein H
MQRVRRPLETGFTLVEVMVVMVILGLVSAAVVIAMPDPRGRLTDEAERFAARAAATRNDAILQGRSMSVAVDPRGYAVERRFNGRWQPARDRLFAPVAWGPGTVVVLDETGTARATFDSTGGVDTPVSIALSRDALQVRIEIAGDGSVRVAG